MSDPAGGLRKRMEPILARAKQGEAFRVRAARTSDVSSIARMNRAVVEAGEGVVLAAADLEPLSEQEARLRESVNNMRGTAGAFLVAEWCSAPGIIASSGIWRLGPTLLKHVALLSLEVHPREQGKGVGRRVFERALEWAVSPLARVEPRVERLELYVRQDNTRARALYDSLGFVVESRRERFVRTEQGLYVDDLIMVRWSDG